MRLGFQLIRMQINYDLPKTIFYLVYFRKSYSFIRVSIIQSGSKELREQHHLSGTIQAYRMDRHLKTEYLRR